MSYRGGCVVTEAQVRELLVRVLDDEPPPRDTVTTVYRRADDRVGAAIGRNLASSGLTFRPDARGSGWRRYNVLAAATSVGTLDVAVYTAPVPLCYPKAAGTSDCARDRTTDDGLEYATYTEDDSAGPGRRWASACCDVSR
jgi:hypothetical protein